MYFNQKLWKNYSNYINYPSIRFFSNPDPGVFIKIQMKSPQKIHSCRDFFPSHSSHTILNNGTRQPLQIGLLFLEVIIIPQFSCRYVFYHFTKNNRFSFQHELVIKLFWSRHRGEVQDSAIRASLITCKRKKSAYNSVESDKKAYTTLYLHDE